jgi:hypothetical protein
MSFKQDSSFLRDFLKDFIGKISVFIGRIRKSFIGIVNAEMYAKLIMKIQWKEK